MVHSFIYVIRHFVNFDLINSGFTSENMSSNWDCCSGRPCVEQQQPVPFQRIQHAGNLDCLSHRFGIFHSLPRSVELHSSGMRILK